MTAPDITRHNMAPHGALGAAPSLDPLLTPREAARYLRVSLRTIARWSKEGLIRAVKLGSGAGNRTVRYRRADLDKHIAQAIEHPEVESVPKVATKVHSSPSIRRVSVATSPRRGQAEDEP